LLVPSVSLDQLLAETGSAEPHIRQILIEVVANLLEARLVVSEETWHRVSANEAFAISFLNDVLGESRSSWDQEHLLGAPALRTLYSVNSRAHTFVMTTGGGAFRSRVIAAQGGEFCSACGRRDDLVVDHIIPVSVGGSPDTIANMQMLCQDCNLGKSKMGDRLLPAAVALHTSSTVSARLRFKHLVMTSIEVGGRTRGVCSCGRTADEVEFRVVVGPKDAAANLLNLRTNCSGCQEA
jgi:hypothetical protein